MSLEGHGVYYTYQGQSNPQYEQAPTGTSMFKEEALKKFAQFIREWKHEEKFVYRYKFLREHVLQGAAASQRAPTGVLHLHHAGRPVRLRLQARSVPQVTPKRISAHCKS